MTDKGDESVITSHPPTRIVTVKNEYTVKDQDEMLALAQKQFDYMRRKNRERARSSRYQLLSRGSRITKPNQDQMKVRQLLSSLLYLSLMMHKVEDTKKILEHRDPNVYHEWIALLGSLHSPVFHMRERRIQNERAKKMFNRKNKYKAQYETAKADFVKSQESLQQVSHAVAKLSEENKAAHMLLNQQQNVEKDLASERSQSEMRQTLILKQEVVIRELKSECSELHKNIDLNQTENRELQQSIKIHENDAKKRANDISSLNDDIDLKRKQIQEFECRIVAIEKDLDCYRIQLNQELQAHESTKSRLNETETRNNEKISVLQKQVMDAYNDVTSKTTELELTQKQLRQIQQDSDAKATALKEALAVLRAENDRNKCLEEQQNQNMRDIADLKVCVEKTKSENLQLTTSLSSSESNLRNEINNIHEEVKQLKHEVTTKEVQLANKEQEAAVLTSTITSLKQSLSEAVQSKMFAEEQKQKLLDGAMHTVNQSIEKLADDNLRITNMMNSIKNSIVQDLHDAIEKQKVSEGKAELLHNQLVQTEKEVAILTNAKASLEISLSDALTTISKAEELRQNVIDGEATSNVSIQKLSDEHLEINKMITSMKESLTQYVQTSLVQEKIAKEKANTLQSQLLEREKEIAILQVTNKSLQDSLSEALKMKTDVEHETQRLLNDEEITLKVSTEKLSSENVELSEMISSIKNSLMQDIQNALQQQQLSTSIQNASFLGLTENVCAPNTGKFDHKYDSGKDKKTTKNAVSNDEDDLGNVATNEANVIVSKALDIAITKISST